MNKEVIIPKPIFKTLLKNGALVKTNPPHKHYTNNECLTFYKPSETTRQKPLILIISETRGGKDTVAERLHQLFNFKPVCSYTTRPMRPGEINGVEHWFIDEDEAKILLETKTIIAKTEIVDDKTKAEFAARGEEYKGYTYFATDENVQDADVYIINPKGIEDLKKNHPEIPTTTIFIQTSKTNRKDRAIAAGNDLIAFEKRCLDEHVEFDRFFEKMQKFNPKNIVNNDGDIETTMSNIIEILQKEHIV